LIYEGFVRQGLAIAQGVRERHDGIRRNPWNEFECGNHYARSMSSYSLLTALSGFQYSAPEKYISFTPRISRHNFKSFFSVGSGWGLYSREISKNKLLITIDVRYGNMAVSRIGLGRNLSRARRVSAMLGNTRLVACVGNNAVNLGKPVMINAGKTLKIDIRQ
jgi:hypothetical protein